MSKLANENWKWIIYTLIKALEDSFSTWLNWIKGSCYAIQPFISFSRIKCIFNAFKWKRLKNGNEVIALTIQNVIITFIKQRQIYVFSSITFACRWTCKCSLLKQRSVLQNQMFSRLYPQDKVITIYAYGSFV